LRLRTANRPQLKPKLKIAASSSKLSGAGGRAGADEKSLRRHRRAGQSQRFSALGLGPELEEERPRAIIGRAPMLCLSALNVDLLGDLDGVIHLNAEVASEAIRLHLLKYAMHPLDSMVESEGHRTELV